jgi:hypothetical protein
LDASCDGVEGFERREGGFGCDLAAGRPCLGGVEGVGGGWAVLGTDEDRNSQVAAVGLVEVVLGRAGAVEADVRRAMQIMEPPMVRTTDLCQMGEAVHLASPHKPKHGDGQEEALLAGSSLLRRVVWEWARGSSSASHEGH